MRKVISGWWLYLGLIVLAVVGFSACGGAAARATPTPTQAAAPVSTPMAAAGEPLHLGWMCDRTGPTQLVGAKLCAGFRDYIKLVNSKGGILGHPLVADEIEMAYDVPRGVEAYQRLKGEGQVTMFIYGTPQTYALTKQVLEDKIPVITPGFGRADSTDGKTFPYIFPMAASYWSQGAAATQYVTDQWQKGGKDLKDLKVAFIYYDNDAGREPIPILEELAQKLGFQLRKWAVPPPGVEMSAQVTDIVTQYKPDWVIGHLFGNAPSVSIKEFKKNGYPLDKVLSLVWGAAVSDVKAAGVDLSKGYLALQFAGAKTDYSIDQEIIEMYRKEGKEPKELFEDPVYYNRGVLSAAIQVEGLRRAIEQFGWPPTGENVKRAYENLKDFTLGGMLPPLNVTEDDHEGGGFVQVAQWDGTKWVLVTDWFNAFRDMVLTRVKDEAAKFR